MSSSREHSEHAGSFEPHVPPESTGELKSGVQRLRYGNCTNQFVDLRLPTGSGPHPVVVLIHGGGFQAKYHLDLMDPLGEGLLAEGFAVWNIEYRGIGLPGAGWPETFRDVSQAVDQLHQAAGPNHLDLNRAVALGHSAGGHLALWAAARHRLPVSSPLRTEGKSVRFQGVVALAPMADLRQVWEQQQEEYGDVLRQLLGGSPAEVPEHYEQGSPTELLPLGLPQTVIHGTEDRSVPISFSRSYTEAAQEAGDTIELIELDGVDHFAVLYPQLAPWSTILRAVNSLLT